MRLKVLVLLWVGACLLAPVLYLVYRRELADVDLTAEHVDLIADNSSHVHRLWFKNLKRNYTFTQTACGTTKLLFAVVSAPADFEMRSMARRTWFNDLPTGASAKFFIGAVSNKSLHERILLETNTHRDIVRYSLEDSYDRLVLKSYVAIDWAQTYCAKLEHVVKMDVDVVPNLDLYVPALRAAMLPVELLLFGEVQRNMPTLRWPYKNHLTRNDYAPATLPSYCRGATYALTAASAHRIVKSMKGKVRIMPAEDVFITGILSPQLRIGIVDSSTQCANLKDSTALAWKSFTMCEMKTTEQYEDTYKDIKNKE